MNNIFIRVIRVIRGRTRMSALPAVVLLMAPYTLHAQSASLLGLPGDRPVLTLQDNSWCFQKLDPPKQLQVNDHVTVIVKENSQYTSEGEVDRRKRANIDAVLQDWVRFDGLSLKPAPQADGDPRIKASLNSQLRSEMQMETTGIMQFRIRATVVEVKPNGTLVLEARQRIENNNEVWVRKLTGLVAREAILPNGTVLSENIADLRIEKCETGHVRDAYKRGWLSRWVDKWKPF
jgi:flagellar L-ring protein precursor FlgH